MLLSSYSIPALNFELLVRVRVQILLGSTFSDSPLPGFYANGHNLSLARHAANKYVGWVKTVLQSRLSHEPWGPGLVERVTV